MVGATTLGSGYAKDDGRGTGSTDTLARESTGGGGLREHGTSFLAAGFTLVWRGLRSKGQTSGWARSRNAAAAAMALSVRRCLATSIRVRRSAMRSRCRESSCNRWSCSWRALHSAVSVARSRMEEDKAAAEELEVDPEDALESPPKRAGPRRGEGSVRGTGARSAQSAGSGSWTRRRTCSPSRETRNVRQSGSCALT